MQGEHPLLVVAIVAWPSYRKKVLQPPGRIGYTTPDLEPSEARLHYLANKNVKGVRELWQIILERQLN